MFKFKGINHLAMVTADLEKTIRFWRDLLGMKLIGGQGDKDFKQYFFEIHPGSYIAFYQWEGVEPIIEKDAGRVWEGKIAFDHVCFELENREKLWELKDKLEAAGEWVSEVVDNGFIHSVFAFDPNNISIEFCYSLPEVDVTKDLRLVDDFPLNASLEGPFPKEGIWPKVVNPTPEKERKVYAGDLKQIITGKNVWGNN